MEQDLTKTARTIRSDSPIPIPSQLRSLLLQAIEKGLFTAGQRIPSERRLAERYGVSRASVRETMVDLIGAGVLFRTSGRGTFVAERPRLQRKPIEQPHNIAFFISERIFHFVETAYNRILAGVEETCRERGCSLLFRSIDEGENAEIWNGQGGRGSQDLDGVVIVGGIRRRSLERLREAGVPYVLVDPLIAEDLPDPVAVRIDYAEGTRLAIEHFYNLGHREIGFIGFPGSDKYRAYWQCLEQCGLSYNPRHVEFLQLIDLPPGILAGFQAARKMLAETILPSSLLVTNDLVAMGVLEALGIAKVSVPQQMSVVGFDDIDGRTSPPLTSVRVNLVEAGRLAARTLFSKIEQTLDVRGQTILRVELVVRESTGPPSSAHEDESTNTASS